VSGFGEFRGCSIFSGNCHTADRDDWPPLPAQSKIDTNMECMSKTIIHTAQRLELAAKNAATRKREKEKKEEGDNAFSEDGIVADERDGDTHTHTHTRTHALSLFPGSFSLPLSPSRTYSFSLHQKHDALKTYNTLQHAATRCNTWQHTATHCNTLQHIATHCNTLQHTAMH